MKLFAIGDLHMSSAIDKPMNVFGDNWDRHEEKIFDDWTTRVRDEDTVLVVGDISWASKINDAKMDLDKIEEMPGRKIFIRGNHDYWWTTASALNKLPMEIMLSVVLGDGFVLMTLSLTKGMRRYTRERLIG